MVPVPGGVFARTVRLAAVPGEEPRPVKSRAR
jgi:hypothetical protein